MAQRSSNTRSTKTDCRSQWHSPTRVRFKAFSVVLFSNPSPLPPELDAPPVSLVVEPPEAPIAESEENCQRPRRARFRPCHLEDYEVEI